MVFWYVHTKKIPKFDRYTIGEKVFDLLLEITTDTRTAEYQSAMDKRLTLEKISRKINSVKILVRLTNSLQIIDEKIYIKMESDLQEIGRMLGGWIRSLPSTKRTPF